MEEKLTLFTPPAGPYLLFANSIGDELAGAGGLLGYACKSRINVGVVFIDEHSEKQKTVGQKALAALNAKYIEFWDIDALDEETDAALYHRLEKLLNSQRPATLLMPSIYASQRALTARLTAILQQLDFAGEVWCYETTQQLPANRLLDISAGLTAKKAAIRHYNRQPELNRFLKAAEGLNQSRTWQSDANEVEAFWAIAATELSTDSLRDSVLNTLSDYTEDLQNADETPLISVIVRTKNRPSLLKKALRSIAEQTWTAVEAVVVNDGGEDVSNIVKSFQKKIANGAKLIQYDLSKGRSAAANQGIQAASGDWIAFLDDDDTLEPNGLAILARHISWDKEFIYGQVQVMHMEAGKKRARKGDIWGDDFNADRFALENYIPICAFICKRQHAIAVDTFDEKFDALEDWDFLFRLSRQIRFYYVSAVVANYCIWGESYYNSQDREKEQHFRKLFFEKNFEHYAPDVLSRASLAFIERRNSAVEATVSIHNSVVHSLESGYALEISALRREIDRLNAQLSSHQEQLDAKLQHQKNLHDIELGQLEAELQHQQNLHDVELEQKKSEINYLHAAQANLNHNFHSTDLLWRRRLYQLLKRLGRSVTLESEQQLDFHHYGVMPVTRAFSSDKNAAVDIVSALDGAEEAIPILSGKTYEWSLHWSGKKPAQLLLLKLATGNRVNKCYLQLEILRRDADSEQLKPYAISTFDGRDAEDGEYGAFLLDNSLTKGEYVCRLTSPDADNMENTLFIWLTIHFKAQYSDLHFPNYQYVAPNTDVVCLEATALKKRPKISIIIPVYNPEPEHLKACLDSVINQVYPEWELCITDDASTKSYVKKILEDYQQQHPDKIKVAYNTVNQHIAGASNDALELAEGAFIGLLDHDDLLAEDALLEVVKQINKDGADNVDIIYSDEDKWDDEGEYFHSPYFKPDWSPDMLKGQMYLGHFLVLRKALVEKVGGFRSGFDGSQDWDLALRATEKARAICHISKILYHWRKHDSSTASQINQKSYTANTGLNAVQEALDREKEGGVAEFTEGNHCLIRYPMRGTPRISIVIPTRDMANILGKCLESFTSASAYQNFEIIIVDNDSVEDETFELFKKYEKSLGNKKFKIKQVTGKFNFSRSVNEGVKASTGELILLLNNDTALITPDEWLIEMGGYAQRPEIGAVGCKLLYSDDTLQHAGVVCGIGEVAGHSHKYISADNHGYMNRLSIVSNYSAVTAACLMIKRRIWDEVGGFDEKMAVAFNDVDFCLKVLEKGYRNLMIPHVKLYHFESKSRGQENTPEKQKRFLREIQTMRKRWGNIIEHDPYYNRHLSHSHENFSLDANSIYFRELPEELV